MNKKEFNSKVRIIQENFGDNRRILYPTPQSIRNVDEGVHPGGDIFTTEDGDFIDLETQFVDFDEKELTKKVEFAENLYEKHHKHISIYILCPKEVNVVMRECVIKSEAEFTIKLTCIQQDSCELFLRHIKNKIKNHITLDSDEIHGIYMLPMMCDKEYRNYYREESFKIINSLED